MAGGGEDVCEAVRATGLLVADGPVVVMLSGGRDSTCLLDVAVRIAGAPAVRALHVDYGLREESAADAAHCEALGRRYDVAVEIRRPRRPEGSGNLQAWARDARYAAGAEAVATTGGVLAAGHTASDQAETVLYRLATSPGRRALLGMSPRTGRLVRPLLGVTREQTAAHCAANGLPWREDASNASPAFARSRVRHGLLAALEAVDDRAAANIVRTATALREEAAVLDEVVGAALDGRDEIAMARLATLPTALSRLVVRALAEAATGAPVPRAASRLEDVLALGDDGAVDIGDGARIVVADGIVRADRTPRRPAGHR